MILSEAVGEDRIAAARTCLATPARRTGSMWSVLGASAFAALAALSTAAVVIMGAPGLADSQTSGGFRQTTHLLGPRASPVPPALRR